MFNFNDPQKASQLVRDTLAEFLSDLGNFDQGEPRLVILSKPGVQLVMLGGQPKAPAIPAAIEPNADTRITADMARQHLARLEALKAQPARVPTPPPAPPKAAAQVKPPVPPRPVKPAEEPDGTVQTERYRGYEIHYTKTHDGWTYDARSARHGFSTPLCFPKAGAVADAHAHIDHVHHQAERNPPPAPTSSAAQQASQVGGSPYACFGCKKKTHKRLQIYAARELGYQIDQAHLCPTCRNIKRTESINAVVQEGRLQANSTVSRNHPAPAPLPAIQNQPGQDSRGPGASQEEGDYPGDWDLPETEEVFTEDQF